ncbi:hypothetical protein BGX30_009004 [Mortierella sp. GBA39]|nr:hypothetical protein BGX30_009004 [Mortierella sp. GBA39]
MEGIPTTSVEPTASSTSSAPLLKAVYQPTFRFRRWLEDGKHATQEREQGTIVEIEGRLPPLKGQSARVVGGSVGRPRDSSTLVLIGVGLAKFSTRSGLPSLDSNFLPHFIKLARSLVYLVDDLNEYYTGKKCPQCGLFVVPASAGPATRSTTAAINRSKGSRKKAVSTSQLKSGSPCRRGKAAREDK